MCLIDLLESYIAKWSLCKLYFRYDADSVLDKYLHVTEITDLISKPLLIDSTKYHWEAVYVHIFDYVQVV